MEVKIKTEKYNIIASGLAFIPPKENKIEFDIQANETFNFAVSLEFVEAKGSEQNISANVIDNKIMIKCTNFKESGTGINDGIELATASGKKIFLYFWHYKMTEKSPRKIEYSFFQEQ